MYSSRIFFLALQAGAFHTDAIAIPADLLRQANRGLDVYDEHQKLLRFRSETKRVVIDIGAYHLHYGREFFPSNLTSYGRDDCTTTLIAVEPMLDSIRTWPVSDCLLVLPAAVSTTQGYQKFYVNKAAYASSLNPSLAQSWYANGMETEEVLSVPVITLASIIQSIPAHINISGIKTDCQGKDLQILQSAVTKDGDGMDLLRRVEQVRMEVILDHAQLYDSTTNTVDTVKSTVDWFLEHRDVFRFDKLWAVSIGQVDLCVTNTQMGKMENSWFDERICNNPISQKPEMGYRQRARNQLPANADTTIMLATTNRFPLYRYFKELFPDAASICFQACQWQSDCRGFWVFDEGHAANPGVCITYSSWPLPEWNSSLPMELLELDSSRFSLSTKVVAKLPQDDQWFLERMSKVVRDNHDDTFDVKYDSDAKIKQQLHRDRIQEVVFPFTSSAWVSVDGGTWYEMFGEHGGDTW